MSDKKPGMLGRKHVVKSSAWVFGGQIGGQVLRLLSNLIMTRLLVPEMFGVMAVANTVILGLSLCSYIGLHHNIIQSPKGDDADYLNAAWALQVVRGIVLWVIALLIGFGLHLANQAGIVPVDSAYADTSLPMIIAALSFIPLITGFETIKLASASRHMQVGRLTVIEIGSQFLGLLIMIGIALFYKSIWALVIGTIASIIIKVIAGYIVLPDAKNSFHWDKKTILELFHFGKWILLTTIMGFFVKNSDKLILGALITPQLLGIYSIAIFMITALQDVIYRWAGAIALPIFSRVHREDNYSLKESYYKFSIPFNLVTLFLSGFLFNAGYIIIELLYDTRYQAAGAMIQILAVSLIGSRTILAEQCYVAVGKPKLSVPMNILQLLLLFGGLAPIYRHFGMDGALYIIALTMIITIPLTWYFLKKLGILDLKRELMTLPAILLGYGASRLFVMAYEYIKQSIIM